jgi:parallel beta-helix repeat protein
MLLPGAIGNEISGNYIGTDATGTAAFENGAIAVRIYEGASSNSIGPGNVISGNGAVFVYGGASYNTIGPGNVISGKGGAGVEINGGIVTPNGIDVTGNHILGNFIGTDAPGREALGNTSAGVRIISCSDNTLTDNTVSNNHYGIQLQSSSDNQIYNNNFIDNTIQTYVTGRGGNIFNLEKPIGGNYWSDWTSPDVDGDGFVDSPYVFTGGVDYLPWARQDGWLPPPTMSEALDTPLSFTTGGNADWFSQTMTSYHDGDAAQSGDISHNQESWMQTTVSGAGTVTFSWKVSSEAGYDFLEFYIDGSLEDQINGSVDWQQKTYTISTLGSHTLEWRYVKDKGTDSGSDCGWVDKLEWVPTLPPDPLSEALDTALSFTTGGNEDWFNQTTTSQYGGDAAQSGDISHNQESWMQTTVNGTGTVAFYWKVSSEEDFDFLEFYIDGSLEDQISGSVNWEQETYTISTLGSHTLEWRYVKDKDTDSGSDCGWVDKVEWVTN